MGRWEDDRTISAKINELENKYGHVMRFLEELVEHPRWFGLFLLIRGIPKGDDEIPNRDGVEQR